MLERRRGTQARLAFLADVRAGRFRLVDDLEPDLDRIAELVERYADLPLGTVDASVVALTERLGLHEVATLDHRDFSVVRPGTRVAQADRTQRLPAVTPMSSGPGADMQLGASALDLLASCDPYSSHTRKVTVVHAYVPTQPRLTIRADLSVFLTRTGQSRIVGPSRVAVLTGPSNRAPTDPCLGGCPPFPKGHPTMSTEQQHPDAWTEHQAATKRTSEEALAKRSEERADIEEDRHRQQELDDAEMGGES